MSRRGRRVLLGLIAGGALARLVVTFATEGAAFDIESLAIVQRSLERDGLEVYSAVNGGFFRWPYPPGYFPWIEAAEGLHRLTGLPFHGWIQLPSIVADAAIAWLVQDMLGRGGAAERVRLAAAGLVALGPTFFATSGYHGQIDSLAILPAVAALAVWQRGGPNRALAAGALIGAGAAIKTFPLVMILALLPTARSWRERVWLAALPPAILGVLFAPFLAADFQGTADSLDNRGFPGLGGVSLIVQPGLAKGPILDIVPPPWNAATEIIMHHGEWVVGPLMLAVGALLVRARVEPLAAAVVVWLALWAFGLNFALQYGVWALPFLLVQGRLRTVAALQLLLLPAALLFYLAPWEGRGWWIAYCAVMIAAWLAFVGLLAQSLVAIRRARTAVA